MLTLLEDYWQPISEQLLELFRSIYFDPLIYLFPDEKFITNSSNILIEAINKGKIKIQDNIISGQFNLAISKELSKFASFDGRSKTFKIKDISILPTDVKTASFIANEKMKKLYAELNRRISFMDAEAKKKFKNLKFDINKTADQIESYLKEDFKKLGIMYKPSETIKKNLIKQYNQNQELNIKNWNDEQIERLRDTVTKSAYEGLNIKQLQETIQNEYEVTKSKSIFLARQETSLFLSDLSLNRYSEAGIKLYYWSGTGDNREVGNPAGLYPKGNAGHGNHFILNGKVCKIDDPTVYAENLEEALKNIWKSKASIGADNMHPGQSFLCRCRKRPIVT